MLQLILGRAGYGKTEYVFSKIKSLVESGEKDILLLVPEQFSFVSERRLLTDLKEDKVGCVDSFSFSCLGVELSSKYGGDELPVLTKGARAVMMKRAIETVQDSLRLFNRNITSNSFINSVLKIYDEMKSCRVSIDDILISFSLASSNSEIPSPVKYAEDDLNSSSVYLGIIKKNIKEKYYISINNKKCYIK